MTTTLCTEQDVIDNGGVGANSVAVASSALLTRFINKAEGFICSRTRRSWVSDYSSISSDRTKELLKNCCSAMAGKDLVKYDMSGYFSRQEAEILLDVLHDEFLRSLGDLENLDAIDLRGVTD